MILANSVAIQINLINTGQLSLTVIIKKQNTSSIRKRIFSEK